MARWSYRLEKVEKSQFWIVEFSRNHKEGEVVAVVHRGVSMAERATVCTASGVPLVEKGSTTFPCPACGEPIGRSPRCRNQGVTYVCTSCGFQGP